MLAKNSTGNVVGDALLGNFQNYQEGERDQQWQARFWQYEFYAQDNWRATSRLTLDLGVRYNIIAPLYSALNNFSTSIRIATARHRRLAGSPATARWCRARVSRRTAS